MCAEPYPTVLRSELRALTEILRHSSGDLTVHVDNLEVVEGMERGQQYCCMPNRDGADIGREV